MPSLKLSLLAVTATLFSAARADYYINPDSVALIIRKSWCTSEISTCPIICEQVAPYSTLVNTCDPVRTRPASLLCPPAHTLSLQETLTYGCVCGNNLQPNVSEYSLTLPYFVCQEWGNQCVTACGQDNTCSSNCRQDHPCGALNPKLQNTTSSATASATVSSTATSSDTIYTGLGDSGGSSSQTNAAAGRSSFVGISLTLGGLAAGFAMLL